MDTAYTGSRVLNTLIFVLLFGMGFAVAGNVITLILGLLQRVGGG